MGHAHATERLESGQERVSLGFWGYKSTLAHWCPSCIAPHPSSSGPGAVEGQGGFLQGCSWALWGCEALHGAGSAPVGHGTRGSVGLCVGLPPGQWVRVHTGREPSSAAQALPVPKPFWTLPFQAYSPGVGDKEPRGGGQPPHTTLPKAGLRSA